MEVLSLSSASADSSSSSSSSSNLVLDPAIRDWVVLPLLVIMIAAGLLRQKIGVLLKPPSKKIPFVEGVSKSHLARSARLRGGAGNFLASQKWEARRRYLSSDDHALLKQQAEWAETTTAEAENSLQKTNEDGSKAAAASGSSEEMMNPMSTMMDGMKGQMAFMVQNMIMMQGISHFFKGFVLVKVPFPLTNGFKMMFQRGLDLTTLDTSYVSSVSWYFLVMFGLRAFFKLVMGEPSQEQMESTQLQISFGLAPPGAAQQPQGFDAPKVLRNEAENLQLVAQQKSWIDGAERRLLGPKRYPKKKINTKNGGDDLLFGGYGGGGGTSSSTISKKKKKV